MAKDAVISTRTEDLFRARVDAAAKQSGLSRGDYLIHALELAMSGSASSSALTEEDRQRLKMLRQSVFVLMRDGKRRTLSDIARELKCPEGQVPSISTRLREFRRPEYGGHKLTLYPAGRGLYEYRLEVAK